MCLEPLDNDDVHRGSDTDRHDFCTKQITLSLHAIKLISFIESIFAIRLYIWLSLNRAGVDVLSDVSGGSENSMKLNRKFNFYTNFI